MHFTSFYFERHVGGARGAVVALLSGLAMTRIGGGPRNPTLAASTSVAAVPTVTGAPHGDIGEHVRGVGHWSSVPGDGDLTADHNPRATATLAPVAAVPTAAAATRAALARVRGTSSMTVTAFAAVAAFATLAALAALARLCLTTICEERRAIHSHRDAVTTICAIFSVSAGTTTATTTATGSRLARRHRGATSAATAAKLTAAAANAIVAIAPQRVLLPAKRDESSSIAL